MITSYYSSRAITRGLKGEYYAGTFGYDLSFFAANTPKLTLVTPDIDFELSSTRRAWPDLSAVTTTADKQTGVPSKYSARYSASLEITTGATYTFYLTADDGGYLWIGQNALNPTTSNTTIDVGGFHAPTERMQSLTLEAGTYPLLIIYQNDEGGRALQLYYSCDDLGINKTCLPQSMLIVS